MCAMHLCILSFVFQPQNPVPGICHRYCMPTCRTDHNPQIPGPDHYRALFSSTFLVALFIKPGRLRECLHKFLLVEFHIKSVCVVVQAFTHIKDRAAAPNNGEGEKILMNWFPLPRPLEWTLMASPAILWTGHLRTEASSSDLGQAVAPPSLKIQHNNSLARRSDRRPHLEVLSHLDGGVSALSIGTTRTTAVHAGPTYHVSKCFYTA